MDSDRARAFIDEQFLLAYGAKNVVAFSQFLVTRGPVTGQAALGYRRAGSEPLFLERYFDQPIEQLVSKAFERQIERQEVIEIGNLAADNAWSMVALWGKAANDLGGSGEIVVATLTAGLRHMLNRIGVPLHRLSAAEPHRLGPTCTDWGDYYRADPWICAGSIAEGQRAIASFLAHRRWRAA